MTKRILLIGAHGDDEVASAGFLSKFLRRGHEVFVVIFSFGNIADIAVPEFDACLKVLGIEKENSFKYQYPIRHFPEYRQPILEELVALRKEIKPHVVLVPNSMDIHQDHHVVFSESRRAFDKCTILGYESPKHLLSVNNICYVRLNTEDCKKKIACMDCYKSQAFRMNGGCAAFWEPLAKLRGIQAGCKYAEAFEVIRMVS